MSPNIVPGLLSRSAQAGCAFLLTSNAGERAGEHFVEFFTAEVRDENTRLAHARAAYHCFDRGEARGPWLQEIKPTHITGYIGRHRRATRPPMEQHLDVEG